VNELDEETNETHDKETDTGSLGNSSKFLAIRLGALLDQMYRILGELPEWFNQDFVETFLFCRRHDYYVIDLDETENRDWKGDGKRAKRWLARYI
jgi:hypothetical protein